jgi:capsular exopolysaccharide synthesis family protein
VTQAPHDANEISVSLTDLVRFVLRGLIPAVLIAGAVGAAVFVWSERQPAVFQADATLLLARTTGGFTQFGLSPVTAPPIDLGAYRVAAVSDQVLADALRLMGFEEPSLSQIRSLRSRVSTSTDAGVRDSSLLRVEARGETSGDAIARANAVARALTAWDDRRSSESLNRVIVTLERQIEALSEQVRTLQAVGDAGGQGQIEGLVRLRAEQQQQLGYARALVASAQGLLSILQVADTTPRQIAPRPLMTAAVAAFLTVVAVYALLLLRAALNTRLRGAEDIAAATGLPVLAEFPTTGRRGDPRLREASSYLRANLLFNSEDVQPRVFMITSAIDGEGKTTAASELAESFARYGYRTLLIDADLRSPSVIERFEVVGSVGRDSTTEGWLDDPAGGHELLSVSLGTDDHLDVIPQVHPVSHAAELLGRRFRTALRSLDAYDVIVIDTPPLLAVADALMIAPHCTGTVLVVDHQRSDRRKLAAAVGALQRVGVPVLGVVANRVGAVGSGGVSYGMPYGERPARPVQMREREGPLLARPQRGNGRA